MDRNITNNPRLVQDPHYIPDLIPYEEIYRLVTLGRLDILPPKPAARQIEPKKTCASGNCPN